MMTAESHRTLPTSFYMTEDGKLWFRALLRVYRSAKRRKDRKLAEFAALLAYGTQLVKL